MTRADARSRRPRGSIDELPSGTLRVRVYAGIDPLTKKPHYLTETIPRGPGAQREAQAALTRLVHQVNEKRTPRTRATVNQLLDRWLDIGLDVEPSTRQGYLSKIRKHVRPLLGELPIAKVEAETLDAFYAELRRCNDHCDGRRRVVKHHTTAPHKNCRSKCRWHECRPLSDSSIRQIHWILSGAFARGVRWRWLSVNPVDQAEPPALPHPEPHPPTPDEAARLINAAWTWSKDWGTLVWVAMTTGARRGELCALQWQDVNLKLACAACGAELDDADRPCKSCGGEDVRADGTVALRRAIAMDEHRRWYVKDTKAHQQRRIVLDHDTALLLSEARRRWETRLAILGVELGDESYVFSDAPDAGTWPIPDTITQRYERIAASLHIKTTLHALRHYSATELINSGVDIRTVAGRLGHGGGGATTLRVYTAWLSEADQRAASTLSGRMPACPTATSTTDPPRRNLDAPYQRIAADLRRSIEGGDLPEGASLPTIAEIARMHQVSVGTAQRALVVLKEAGLISLVRGHRATVADRAASA